MAMYLFIAAFLTLYGLINFYCFRLVNKAFILNKVIYIILSAFMSFMTISPILVSFLMRKSYDKYLAFLASFTYDYLGFITLLFSSSIFFRILVLIFTKKGHDAFYNFSFSIFISICLAIYGFYEANSITIERITIKDKKITKPVKVAFLSDLHQGHMIKDSFVKKIIEILNMEKIDLLLLGGDILELGADRLSINSKEWKNFNPPFGKIAVSGNHEFYFGYEKSKQIYNIMGAKFIDNQSLELESLNIIGLPDEVYETQYGGKIKDIELLKKEVSQNKFTILIKHRPRVVRTSGIDLQLSGHTHKRQILPFQIVTRLFYPIHSGLYEVRNDYKIYVSRGVGTWGPRMRILSAPEVTIINLLPQQNNKS